MGAQQTYEHKIMRQVQCYDVVVEEVVLWHTLQAVSGKICFQRVLRNNLIGGKHTKLMTPKWGSEGERGVRGPMMHMDTLKA
jgi:hypothetical protein